MYAVREDVQGLVKTIDTVCMKAAQAARDGYQLIVLSVYVDRQRQLT